MTNRRRWFALFALIAVCVATVMLGRWQTSRAQQKLALQQSWDAARSADPIAGVDQLVDRIDNKGLPVRVKWQGSFVNDQTILLDNRMLGPRAGYWVITPFLIAGTDAILVNRGWIERDANDRNRVPSIPRPPAEVVIEGVAVARLGRLLELAPVARAVPGVWQNLDIDAFEALTHRRLVRAVVLQTSDLPDGLERTWPRPDVGIDRHRGYALQWFSLAVLAGLITVVFCWRWLNGRRRAPSI